MIMIRSKEFGLSDMGGGVNENGGLVNRLDKIAAGINTWCWWPMMLLNTRNLWTAYLFIILRAFGYALGINPGSEGIRRL